jgi:O-antigen/teichoic acid export membrane protein
MLGQGALVFGSTIVLGICGFAFHGIALRRLGPDDYGALYALISACSVAALPAGVLVAVVARFAAEFRALRDDSHVRGLLGGLTRAFGVAAVAYLAATIVGARPLSAFLHVPPNTIPLAGAIAGIAMLSAILRSVAQGTQEFHPYVISYSVEGAAKVLGIVALAALGLFGGMLAFLIGTICGAVIIAWALVRRYAATSASVVHYDWKRIAASIAGSAALMLAITTLSQMDVVVVKHSFSSTEAGIYSAASLGGKVLLYLVGFIPTVLLPQATDRHARGERASRPLFAAIGLLLAFALAGLLVFALGGHILLPLLAGGNKYDAALPLLTWYGLAMVFLALTNALGTFGIATHRLAFAVPIVVGAVGTIGSIAIWHASLLSVVQILVVGNALTALAVAVALAIQGVRTVPQTPP